MRKPIFFILSVFCFVFSLGIENSEGNISTTKSFKESLNNANMYYEEMNWDAALIEYDHSIEHCSFLINAIYEIADPYLGSEIKAHTIDLYFPELSDEFKKLRNNLYYYLSQQVLITFRRGMCYYHLKDFDKSLPILLKTLELIDLGKSTSDELLKMWIEAKNAIYTMIKYDD